MTRMTRMSDHDRIEVRPAMAGELDRIGEITVAAYRADHQWLLSVDHGYIDELADAATRAREAELLVAVDSADRPVGTVTVVRPGTPQAEVSRPGELEFRMLAVDPPARGRGVGKLLTAAVLDRARDTGASRVVLCTLPDNEPAQQLYRRLGFRRIPERDWRATEELTLIAYGIEVGADVDAGAGGR